MRAACPDCSACVFPSLLLRSGGSDASPRCSRLAEWRCRSAPPSAARCRSDPMESSERTHSSQRRSGGEGGAAEVKVRRSRTDGRRAELSSQRSPSVSQPATAMISQQLRPTHSSSMPFHSTHCRAPSLHRHTSRARMATRWNRRDGAEVSIAADTATATRVSRAVRLSDSTQPVDSHSRLAGCVTGALQIHVPHAGRTHSRTSVPLLPLRPPPRLVATSRAQSQSQS